MRNWLDLLPERHIVVIGDVMLDHYVTGIVSRISPEAPVPVILVNEERSVPGGAANVAANLAALGVKTSLIGLAGEDQACHDLTQLLGAMQNVDVRGLISVPSTLTTRKLRVIGSRQQIARIDYEDCDAISHEIETVLIRAALNALTTADLIIISDYGKGVCSDRLLTTVLERAREIGKMTIVDPKRPNFSIYRGATVLTPNRQELGRATGMACESDMEAEAAATRAIEQCGAEILMTRADKGMSFFRKNGEPIHLGTVAQAVFDVSGAGDTVVATLAAALSAGLPTVNAMRMANYAAGIVVSKVGTATISPEEMAIAVRTEEGAQSQGGSAISLEQAVAMRRCWEQQKLTVGFTNGCFDLLHPGHVSLIHQAAQHCDRLIVALNSDASVCRLKGATRPIQDQNARADIMSALKGVDAVIVFDEDTPLEAIEALQPDILDKGPDYGPETVVGADLVVAYGGRLVLAQLESGQSTSRLVKASQKAL